MKYFVLILLGVLLLWVASIAWSSRRKPASDHRSGDGGTSDSGSSSSCGGGFGSDDGCSDGGGDGGGD